MTKALVTGGTGFVGSSVVRRLLQEGVQVQALVRAGSNRHVLDGLPVEYVTGDLRDLPGLKRAIKGCQQVYHVAALYTYWHRDRQEIYEINVEGTRNVMQGALDLAIERVVYTSSVATLGLLEDGTPANEWTPSSLSDMVGEYKRSKFMAEKVVRQFASRGLPVVIVNPSTPLGPRDIKPTPTGQMVLDFINGKMPAYVDTGLNFVDVEDVALGHWLAAQKGQIGERYILGRRNMTLAEFFQLLSEISGQPAPRVRIPHSAAMFYAYIDTFLARINPRRIPRATLDTVRLSHKHMYFDSSRAIKELGFPQTDIGESARKAIDWYSAEGYIKNKKLVVGENNRG
jgi:dihydroflavonol-4-reductase